MVLATDDVFAKTIPYWRLNVWWKIEPGERERALGDHIGEGVRSGSHDRIEWIRRLVKSEVLSESICLCAAPQTESKGSIAVTLFGVGDGYINVVSHNDRNIL